MSVVDVKEIIHDAVTIKNALVVVDKEEGSIYFYPSALPALTKAIGHWINANIERNEEKKE